MQLVEDVNHQRELFLVNYTEIGNGHGVAAELQMEHEQFAAESLVSGHDARGGVVVRLSRLCIPCHLEIINVGPVSTWDVSKPLIITLILITLCASVERLA